MRKLKLTLLAAPWLLVGVSCNTQPSPPAIPPPADILTRDYSAAKPNQPDPADKLAWPREFKQGQLTIDLYQPQVEKWSNNQLEARAAVSIEKPGQEKQPIFGVITLSARTEVFKERRTATLNEVKVTSASFPIDKANEETYRAAIDQALPDVSSEIALDHLEANFATTTAMDKAAAVPVKNDPPQIMVAMTPTLLIMIDGAPQLRPVKGQEKVQRVLNTRALILLDQTSNTFWLAAMGRWYKASTVQGPWTAAPTLPPANFVLLRDQLVKDQTVDVFNPANPEEAPKAPPVVVVATTPTELIQLEGEPKIAAIPGTNLLTLSNTDSAVFVMKEGKPYYVLMSGRWFTAETLAGPWTFVAGKDLPPDFAKIPADNPKANVLVSVPGTPQAEQAVVANDIPQTATVKIAEAKIVVSYDGEPRFQPIAGTSGLQYATNSALPVILVEQPKAYYSVSNGIWFTCAEPAGEWVAATSVPPVIYTIPTSSPVHYVTYVRIYGTAPGVVYVGYTPGYMGTCVTSDGVVVYGTGYYYAPYVSTTVWYGYPPTYGYGASFACGTMTGFAFGFSAGAMMGGCWSYPYWGPCWGYSNVDINTSNVYRSWGGNVTRANTHVEWETGEGGNWNRKTQSFNPYTGRATATKSKGWVEADGDFTAKRGGVSYNPRTGIVSGAGRQSTGNIYDGSYNEHSGAFKYNTKTGTGVGVKNGDVYAGKDGNVYRNQDGNWQKRSDSGGWEDAQRANNFSQQRQSLDSQRQSRTTGQQRFNSTRSSGGFSGGGMRGGGGRGGGGRR